MRAFVEIVDQGSLTAAGRALDRSLPAMVRTLASLEEALGATLLRRTTRRMSLTEEGRAYLERCRRILADIEEAEAVVGQGLGDLRGELRVSTPVLFGQMHVVPAVTEFLERHTGVAVQLQLLDRVVDLVDEGIDAAVRIGPLADSSMVAIPAGEVRRVVCASPELLRVVGEPERPEALAEQSCVRFSGVAAGPAWHFDDGGRDLSVPVRGRLVTNQARAGIEACVRGLGFGSFLSYQVEPDVREGRLVRVLRGFEPPPLPVSLVYPSVRLVSARLRAFLDWMKPRLRERRELD